jgi:hypothetical protein
MNIDQVEQYIRTKQVPLNPVRNRGRLVLNINDFTGGIGGGDGELDMATKEEIARLAREIQEACDTEGLRWYDVKPDESKLDVEAGFRQIQQLLGLNYSRAQQMLELLGKVDGGGGEPPPIVTKIGGFFVTYNGHGLAIDGYPGLTEETQLWGPHHGIDIIAPDDVIVESYSFPTPLNVYATMDEETRQKHRELLADWSCVSSEVAARSRRLDLIHGNDSYWTFDIVEPSQIMNVAVMRFVNPRPNMNHFHFGHVHPNIKTGRVPKDTKFATVWDTGIRWEPRINARAAHVHICVGRTATLSPNGDVPGALALPVMGWNLHDMGIGPGPQEYESGQYVAGRRRQDFTSANKPLPPVPA